MRMRCKERYGALRRWGSAAVLWLGAASAAQAAHVVEAVPAWVDWAVPAAPSGDSAGNDRIALLTDDQALFDGARSEWFHRRVSQVMASSGSDDASELSVAFDPGYQSVVLHGAWVERGGRREDRLASARIDELRREDGLESGLIDGKLTLHLVLDDVRVGDRVDIALSVRGENPALAGQAYGYWPMQVGIPTRLRRLRLLHRAGEAFPFRAIGTLPEVRRERQGEYDSLEWRVEDALPLRGEDDGAAWFDAGPSVEFGGARDWAAVVDWALPLYAGAEDRAVAALAQELGLARGDASEANVRRAIAFVQDEIRYTGLELGAHAYQPYPPGEVIRRRYGDCKDKATLLVGLLRHLGLQAHPALVDVDERERIAERLPAPGVFDHVIVRFTREGREYWVDATAELQRGRLDRLTQADFGRALVIAPGERLLRDIAVPALDQPRIDIDEEFDLRDAQGGLADDAGYRIRTIYRGSSADATRRRFAAESRQQIGEAYAEGIAKHYPGLEMAEPPRLEDDTDGNEVTVHERYVIKGVWRPNEEGGGTYTLFWLNEIDGYLPEPGRSVRRSPLALGDPLDIRQKLTVRLDGGWPAEDDTVHVENPHFDFHRTLHNDGATVTLEGRLKRLSREVPAADAGTLAADLRRANTWMGYELTLGADVARASTAATAADPAAAFAMRGWFDWRLVPLFAAMLATWAWIVYCGLRPGVSPWRGMWFRPRETVRAALPLENLGQAAVPMFLGAAASLLLDTDRLERLQSSGGVLGLPFAFTLALVGVFLLYSAMAALLAWGGRLFGGQARFHDVWRAIGWASVPSATLLPLSALALGLYGSRGAGQDEPATLVALVLLSVLVLLPVGVWGAVVWFRALAEVHRFSVARAVVLSVAMPLGLLALGVSAVAAWRGLAGG